MVIAWQAVILDYIYNKKCVRLVSNTGQTCILPSTAMNSYFDKSNVQCGISCHILDTWSAVVSHYRHRWWRGFLTDYTAANTLSLCSLVPPRPFKLNRNETNPYAPQTALTWRQWGGPLDHMLPGYLDEYMYKERFGRNQQGRLDPRIPFENIMLDISVQYPV